MHYLVFRILFYLREDKCFYIHMQLYAFDNAHPFPKTVLMLKRGFSRLEFGNDYILTLLHFKP